MVKAPSQAPETFETDLDRAFIERERNRFAGRALSFLVVLNGAAALILLFVMAQARESSVDGKVAAALLFFASGAIAALLSAFLAYINRTVRMNQSARRENLRAALRGLAIAAVIGSGAAFLVGMNMVATSAVEKTSSHPKGPRQDKPQKPAPVEKVKLQERL
jgi:membrane associated rhomboid family serine protease